MGTLKTTNIQSISGSGTVTLGVSGETFTVPSGVTVNMSSATQTGVGGANTPAFEATLSSNQNISNNTMTKVELATEIFDTDNCYDNSTNYRFTPGVAGKYVLSCTAQVQNCGNGDTFYVSIYKNGSSLKSNNIIPGADNDLSGMITYIDVANTTDYYEFYARQGSGGTQPLLSYGTWFSAYKIIGV
jgi:hypothetical protein